MLLVTLFCAGGGGLRGHAEQASVMPQPATDIPATDTPAVVPGFVELFNGRDLTGWENVNTADDTWSVQDGLLQIPGPTKELSKKRREARTDGRKTI